MRKAKLPVHLCAQAAREGWSKPLALFASLKCIFESSHFWDFRKLNLELVKFGISRPTYMKYLKILDRKALVHGKLGKEMWLRGQDKILELFPNKEAKLNYVYLDNDKNLRDSIERVALESNISAQERKIEDDIRDNAIQPKFIDEQIIKTVRGVKKLFNCLSWRETSLSCKSISNLVGYKSPATGYRRKRKWKLSGFIDSYRRSKVLGRISDEVVRELTRLGKVLVRAQSGWYYQIIADQIEMKHYRFGYKKWDS